MAEARALARMVGGWRNSVPDLAADSEELWVAVRQLPRRQAQAIALTYLDGLSLQETAAVLGISVPTVGTHLQRARKALAASLNVSEEVT
jgi:RNA polymerase sigma-70 factor (ECF subfamily)